MFNQLIFDLVRRVIFKAWMTSYDEYQGSCEVCCRARLGPLTFTYNECMVVDHEDATLGLRIPFFSRRSGRVQRTTLRIGYQVSRGSEQIRGTGWTVHNF